MKAKDFPFESFNEFSAEKNEKWRDFHSNKTRTLFLSQRAATNHTTSDSHTAERSLEAQLDYLYANMQLHSDFSYTFLEPWHGVGVYAAAFGAPTILEPHTSLQTRYRYHSLEELPEDIPYPDYRKAGYLQQILGTIRYFREQTKDRIPISYTDTQGPNDTASLILDSCEMFTASLVEPERLQDLLQKVTDLIIEFTEVQKKEIGEGNVAGYGHQLYADTSIHGISISDDNMAVIGNGSFKNISVPYIRQLGEHFGGFLLHSCGTCLHNLPEVLALPEMRALDCAVGKGVPGALVDPNPNDAAGLRELFLDRDVVLKVRFGPDEVEKVFPLLTPRIKLAAELVTYGSIEQKNEQYDRTKEILLAHYDQQFTVIKKRG